MNSGDPMELLIKIGIITALGAMSPGPDFAMIVRNSLSGSRHAGLFSALGLTVGILFHVTLALTGLSLIFQTSRALFLATQIAGGCYLAWLGWKSLSSSNAPSSETTQAYSPRSLSKQAAFRSGFFTNVLNPKAVLFFIGLFAPVAQLNPTAFFKLAIAVEVALIGFLWFASLSYFLTKVGTLNSLSQLQTYLPKLMGFILIVWGACIVYSAVGTQLI